jgi:GNAT superfamily N-acetyltransferase
MDELVYTLPTDLRARPLIDDLARDYDERYGLNDGVPSSFELHRYPADLFADATGGAFLLVLRDGRAIAGGAFKRVSITTAEIKRVWTHPGFRRQGLAGTVMAELEREAIARGYTTVELTTGARQPEAVALYLGLGYRAQFDLDGDFEAISYLSFTKALAPPSARSVELAFDSDKKFVGRGSRIEA